MKRNQNRKLFKKKSRSNYKLGCIITIVILIPVLYGVYLYCQQFNTQTQKSNEPQVNTSSQIPSGRNLEIPVSLAPKQEQIIRHTGYTVSYNKDLKLPNWVSYELTRQETKGKEKINIKKTPKEEEKSQGSSDRIFTVNPGIRASWRNEWKSIVNGGNQCVFF